MIKGTNLESLYGRLLLIRLCEQQIIKEYHRDEMKTPVHLGIGAEAIAAGVHFACPAGTQYFGTYRNHALYLACSNDTDGFFAEMYGKETGCGKGKAGSMHMACPDHGLIATSAVVATTIPLAAGAALSAQYKNNGKIAVCIFGDGAAEEGVFFETMNFASLKGLPLLMVCEDNDLAIHSLGHERKGFRFFADVAKTFAFEFADGDGSDALQVVAKTQDLLARMQTSGKPGFLHLNYFRFLEHVGLAEDFDKGYREKPKDMIERWDPLPKLHKACVAAGISTERLQSLQEQIQTRIEKSVAAAKTAQFPPAAELFNDVFAPPTTAGALMALNWPLMNNNITRHDLDSLIAFLQQDDPILTQNKTVRAFEAEWSKWLGVRHSVFVNSGASANLITMAAIRHLYGDGEVIVPTLTWVSDIASVLQNQMTPVFVDIDSQHLGMDTEAILAKMNSKTRAVFLTHVLGFNALDDRLLAECQKRGILLIEDTCESHGATHKGRRLGSLGFAGNFSFYFAHHMSTIEGGMVCTNDEKFYQTLRMLRSHGMIREMDSAAYREDWVKKNPDCNPEFIFSYPAYNVRSTELNAALGLSQLKRLDANNEKRNANFQVFLEHLDKKKYRTDFRLEGSSNYAFILILKDQDPELCSRIMKMMNEQKIEFRRGLSGGGNQLRQPYLKDLVPTGFHREFPRVEHVHSYGFYIGNYPDLASDRIRQLCELLNGVD